MSSEVNKTNGTVAFVVVSWNNQKLLKDCLESIKRQDYQDIKIILVDNNSNDTTIDYLRESFPEVRVLPQTQNHGFAKGNNIGIKEALADTKVKFVALLNTDARLDSNWTTTLVNATLIRPKSATLQSITLDFYDHNIIDSTHIYIAHNGQGTQGSWRIPLAEDHEVPPMKIFGCNAAAMLITRSFIEAQPFKDFFDETMFMYLEDVDVATRATVMGWDNYLVPGTRAYHMGSASSSKNPSFSLYMTFRNNLGLLIKNLPFPILLTVLWRLPGADRASIKHLKRLKKDSGIPAIYKGRIVSLMYIAIFVIKRLKLNKHREVNNSYLWHLMRRGF